MIDSDFDRLIEEALAQDFTGWDFSWLHDRWYEEEPPWSYETLVKEKITHAQSLLDMGTGGGEFLASLAPLPAHTVATESYPPNIPVAQARLEPLGVEVAVFTDDKALPLADNQFELITNRHESYTAPELFRLLKPGGRFLSQQVGPRDCQQINQFLNAPLDPGLTDWTIEHELEELQQAGLLIERVEEALLASHFYDIGALVFFLRIIKWQIPDFTSQRYHDRLLAMHRHISVFGAFEAKAQRFLIQARKPGYASS